MHTLILIRHGAFNDSKQELNKDGIIQMENAAKYLKEFFRFTKPILISSTGPRALEGTTIISEYLDIPYIAKEGLLIKNADEFKPDLLPEQFPSVLVSRGEFIRIATEYLTKELGCHNPLPEVIKGTAFAIVCDFEDRTLVKVDF